jgi:hypothetical protein
MTTLEEFRSTIKDMHEKLANPNNTVQKNQALWQYIKEYCARMLEQRDLDAIFEDEIKKELMLAQKQLSDLKKALPANTPKIPGVSSISPPYQGSPLSSSSPSMGFQSESPSNTLSSVPIAPFDPNSSPILRRLAQGKPLNESRIPSVPKPNEITDEKKTDNKAPPKEDAAKSEDQNDLSFEIPEETSSTPESPIASTKFPDFASSPFPSAPVEKMELAAAYLDIPQLNGRIELGPEEMTHRIGREEIKNAAKIQVSPNFYDPIMIRLEEETVDTPSEHFLVEQPLPGEFWIKDTGSLQKTYFKSTFVDAKGIKLQDGDQFIVPVNVNNQLASLTLIFHIKK